MKILIIDKLLIVFEVFLLISPMITKDRIAIQPTASLPKGLYLKYEIQGDLKRGDTVSVTFDGMGRAAEFLGTAVTYPRLNLIKIAAGIPGDLIKITNEGIFINGEWWGPVFERNSTGKLLPKIRGQFRLNKSEYMVLTPHKRSYDSRYFGPVNISQLRRAKPIFLLSGKTTKHNDME